MARRYQALIEQLQDSNLRTEKDQQTLMKQAARAIQDLVEELRLRDEIEALTGEE